jgi:hypothetical protein
MNQGCVGWWLGCGLFGLAAVGCGASDAEPTPGPKMGAATPGCGTVQEPLELTIKDVKPALGSSVANANIVQSFTIVGKLLKLDPTFAEPAAHTAGARIPNSVTWTYAASGNDTVYTSQPVSWTTAPGHVELTPAGLLVTPDNCVAVMPTPTFSYDITVP